MAHQAAYFLLALAGVTFSAGAACAENAPRKGNKDVAVWVRVIDKVSGTPHTLETTAGVVANYQSLSVLPRRCSVNEEGEFAALMEVYDQPPNGGTTEVFSGWMFSTSPSLTFIEHPFYDVSLVKCAPKKEEKEKNPAAKKDAG